MGKIKEVLYDYNDKVSFIMDGKSIPELLK